MRFSKAATLACLSSTSVLASTPPGLQPSSNNDLIVVFGSTLATQGKDIPRSLTLSNPDLGTTQQLYGNYTLMMVDYDIPGGTRLLHWMQPGLVSSTTVQARAGVQVHVLTNTSAPYAPYLAPNPPARAPLSHRYVQLLLNVTNNPNANTILQQNSANRSSYDPEAVVRAAGVTVVAGNWFNVTNGVNATSTTSSATGTAPSATARFTGAANVKQAGIGMGVLGGAVVLAMGMM